MSSWKVERKLEWNIKSFGHTRSTTFNFEIKCWGQYRVKNRVVWPHLLDYPQLGDQMLRKKSSEKSSRLATFARLRSTLRSNAEDNIEWKIKSVGHTCSTTLNHRSTLRSNVEENIKWKIEPVGQGLRAIFCIYSLAPNIRGCNKEGVTIFAEKAYIRGIVSGWGSMFDRHHGDPHI